MKLFTSDLHFFHKALVGHTNRGKVTDTDSHDEWLKDLWNSQVSPADTVYHLGDFSLVKSKDRLSNLLDQLNDQKFFILGNHDTDSSGKSTLAQLWGQHGIAWVGDYKRLKLCGGNQDVMLFHYPMSSWNKQHYGAWHLHSHSHGMHKHKSGKILDVGLDSSYLIYGEHKFFTEDDISRYMALQETVINDSHKDHK